MKKIILIAISLLLISLVVGCAVKKEVSKPTSPAEQDTAATMDKDIEQIDTDLGDTTSIDSGLDELDEDLGTI